MNTLRLLGTGLLKKERKRRSSNPSEEKKLNAKKNAQHFKRAVSVELFLREILGTRLLQREKNSNI
ncbi:MAG: hypothetical protein H7336_16520 [Bacteriovorax sp.]|nr:hypothetical protein [Bacteriovorax sp.]